MITDLNKADCEKVIASGIYAHLACCDGDEPYVVPIMYVYRDGCIYSYTHEGQKIEIMRKNPKMCVQIQHVEHALEWESVMCWGLFEQVTDPKSIQDVKLLLAEKHGDVVMNEGYRPVSPLVEHVHFAHDEDVVIYRMQPYRMTGKASTR